MKRLMDKRDRMSGWRRVARLVLATASGGTMFALGCSDTAIRAVAAGIEAAASSIDNSRDEDISFGDWLASEFGDDD